MQVLVIGATGFLGYHTTLELLARGHQVSALARPPLPAEKLLPPEVNITLTDLEALPDAELLAYLQGQDGLVFAAGVDDRVTPARPAYPFFYKGNVAATERLVRLAVRAGVKRAVIFSSYFLEFERRWPELRLAETHPYIRSRVEQEKAALAAAGDQMAVNFLLLPYIFGSIPGRDPLWKPLVAYLNSWLPWVFYPAGGSAMVSVSEVADAAVMAFERGEAGARYPVCAENLTWQDFLQRLGKILGKTKPVITLPKALVKLGAWFVALMHRLQGRESGLDLVPFVELQTRLAFLDLDYSARALGYAHAELEPDFVKTVQASLPAGRN
ncbi:MAG: NAD(P)H-binding protein [Anaerolineaceae bacterium]